MKDVGDLEFEDGWQIRSIETDLRMTPGAVVSVQATFSARRSIFRVMSAMELLGLVVGEKEVVVVALDGIDGAWRPFEGRVDVPAGARVMFRIKNDGADSADPKIAYIGRTPRSSP